MSFCCCYFFEKLRGKRSTLKLYRNKISISLLYKLQTNTTTTTTTASYITFYRVISFDNNENRLLYQIDKLFCLILEYSSSLRDQIQLNN